jgi:hypothetical protein
VDVLVEGQILGPRSAGLVGHGAVTLGASDTIVAGDATGAITRIRAARCFEFGGDFGNQTIYGFIAGSGPTLDMIQFAANDFGFCGRSKGHVACRLGRGGRLGIRR